jgi:hypothetical protein
MSTEIISSESGEKGKSDAKLPQQERDMERQEKLQRK